MKNPYLLIQDISNIYSISQKKVKEILWKYKIDTYKWVNWLRISLKDFHNVYTTKYNPTLFILDNSKKTTKKEAPWLKFWNYKDLLAAIFPTPVKTKSTKQRKI